MNHPLIVHTPTSKLHVSREALPEKLWELTGGLGGKSGTKLYHSQANAQNLRRQLLRLAEMTGVGRDPVMIKAMLQKYAQEDEQKAGLAPGDLHGAATASAGEHPDKSLHLYLANRSQHLTEHPSPWLHNPDMSTHVDWDHSAYEQAHRWTPGSLEVRAVLPREIPITSRIVNNTGDNGEYHLRHNPGIPLVLKSAEALKVAQKNSLADGDAYCPKCGAIFEWGGDACNRCQTKSPPLAWIDGKSVDRSDEQNGVTKAHDYTKSLRRAEAATHPNPSPAQISAGNAPKGSFVWNGLKITIENPKGSIRRGKNPDKPWQVTMGCAYGYFNAQPMGRDGDPVDVFICDDNLDSEWVYVVNQVTQDGKFDEHKVIIGCASEKSARKAYLSCYSPGWVCGKIKVLHIDEFKDWLGSRRRGVLKASDPTHSLNVGSEESTELEFKPEQVTPNGLIRLYHRSNSSPESFKGGFSRGKESSGEIYASTHPNGQISGFGKTLVSLEVHPKHMELDDAFPDGEMHFRVPPQHAKISNCREDVTKAITPQLGSRRTQRSNTTGNYEKLGEIMSPKVMPGEKVLDYGAGLGLGTDALRKKLPQATVQSYEIQPSGWRGESPVDFTNPDHIPSGGYHHVIALNLLNVLEPELRKHVTKHILSRIAPGGKGFIGTRSWKGDVASTKNFDPYEGEDNSLWAHGSEDGQKVRTFHHGFDSHELSHYVQSVAKEMGLEGHFETTPTDKYTKAGVFLRRRGVEAVVNKALSYTDSITAPTRKWDYSNGTNLQFAPEDHGLEGHRVSVQRKGNFHVVTHHPAYGKAIPVGKHESIRGAMSMAQEYAQKTADGVRSGKISFPTVGANGKPRQAADPNAIKVLAGKSDLSQVRDEKDLLSDRGYIPEEVEAFVDRHYNPANYAPHLRGKDNVFIPMPSTTGNNTIPSTFAARLQREFGGVIHEGDDFSYPLHTTEAKKRTGLAKLIEPSAYEIPEEYNSELTPHQGKNVFLVDDVFTTGDSVRGMSKALAPHGIVPHVAALGAADKSFMKESDMRRLAGKLTNSDHALQNGYNEDHLFSAIQSKLGGFGRHYSNQIERQIFGDTPGAKRNADNTVKALLGS